MTVCLFQSFEGHEQTLRDWLRLGDRRHPEDPSLHDLLDLDETCRDRNLIKTRSVERGSLLRSLEQQVRKSPDPVVNDLLTRLLGYVGSAERLLCDAKAYQQYAAELIDHRCGLFLKYVKKRFDPTELPAADVRQRLEKMGVEMRLAEEQVKKVLEEFFADREEIPELYRDHVKWLGLGVFREDPMWPTHFDMLGLEESSPLQSAAIQRFCATQVAKLAQFERHPSTEKRRRAAAVRLKVETAAKELGSNAAAYLEMCRKRRLTKFEAEAKDHKRLKGDKLTASERARLLRQASGIRLGEADAEAVLQRVFGGARSQPRLECPSRIVVGRIIQGHAGTSRLALRNTGGGTLNVTRVACDQAWAKPSRGALQVRSQEEVSLSVVTAGLGLGNHQTKLRVDSDGGTAVVDVVLDIVIQPSDSTFPQGLWWAYAPIVALLLLGISGLAVLLAVVGAIAGGFVAYQRQSLQYALWAGGCGGCLMLALLPGMFKKDSSPSPAATSPVAVTPGASSYASPTGANGAAQIGDNSLVSSTLPKPDETFAQYVDRSTFESDHFSIWELDIQGTQVVGARAVAREDPNPPNGGRMIVSGQVKGDNEIEFRYGPGMTQTDILERLPDGRICDRGVSQYGSQFLTRKGDKLPSGNVEAPKAPPYAPKAIGKVTKISGDVIAIDLGRRDKIATGQVVRVKLLNSPIFDPSDANLVLGYDEVDVRVLRTEEETCEATVVKKDATLPQPGDVVRIGAAP